MFDIGWSELLLIGIVALVAIGPKELPTVLRTLGQWMAKLRRMATEFQNQFHEAMREAEMADLKKHVDDITATAKGYANFDPVSEVRREFESTQHAIENAMVQSPAAGSSSPSGEGAPGQGNLASLDAPPSADAALPAPSHVALPEPSPAPASGEPVGTGDAKLGAGGLNAGERGTGEHGERDAGGKPA
jgi:sec-independent protein translocase protein TatB